MSARFILVVCAFAAAGGARAESYEFRQAGTLKIDGGPERTTSLHIACSPDNDGGALSVEMTIPEANTRKDFDYDDFEGPDAAAGDKPLSHLVWNAAGGASTEITHTAAGSYIPDPAQAFAFSLSQLSHRRQAPAKLLSAIGPEAGKLVWTQTGFDKATCKLVATFEFDAGAAKKVHDTVATCVPRNSPKNPAP